jgi:hypothetical protein
MLDREIDAQHPLVLDWLGSRAPRPADPPRKKGAGRLPSRDDFTRVQYRRRIAEARRLELANAEREGHLVSRQLVHTHVVGTMHAAFERLLRDTPRSLVARLYALAKAGESVEQGEATARELISTTLQPAVDQMIRSAKRIAPEPVEKTP